MVYTEQSNVVGKNILFLHKPFNRLGVVPRKLYFTNYIFALPMTIDLQRFIDAQATTYNAAFSEISNGRKTGHWMWFIFPQVQGLGMSETSKYYAIQNAAEAAAYLQHPILGSRLTNICEALLNLESSDAHHIFGSPDDVKLQSSMTLFASVPGAPPVFEAVLDKFFNGKQDSRTISILAQEK